MHEFIVHSKKTKVKILKEFLKNIPTRSSLSKGIVNQFSKLNKLFNKTVF